jgi:transcription-repair coupling factor (superfamily II helicase)
MRDLEIRGAGSILGNLQSGHISAVGFDLYVELVAEAVRELEAGEEAEEPPPQVRIDLPVDAHLPDDYVTEQAARLEAYRRLAEAATPEAVDDVVAEWEDRFGPLPPDAAALIDIARLRVEALRLGLTEIVRLHREVKLAPVDLTASQEVRLERLAPRAVIRERNLFVPAPADDPANALIRFLRKMWPPPSQE